MNEKDKNINYIKEVKRLTSLKTICKELNIDNLKTHSENLKAVKGISGDNTDYWLKK